VGVQIEFWLDLWSGDTQQQQHERIRVMGGKKRDGDDSRILGKKFRKEVERYQKIRTIEPQKRHSGRVREKKTARRQLRAVRRSFAEGIKKKRGKQVIRTTC